MKPRQWYRFAAAADGESADLWVYDVIGKSFWDDQTVTAKQFLEDLKALPESVKALRVHVNSPGGDPFDATAIANALRAQRTEKNRTVEVSIEGLAASAATIITSAGAPVRIADNALMMVHNPWSIEMGDAKAMRAMAEALDRVRNSIVATYQWVSPLSSDDLQALMDDTTWMDAADAVKHGFATEIVTGVQVAAQFKPEVIAKLGAVPDRFRARIEAFTEQRVPPPAETQKADPTAIARACREAGFPELTEDLLGQSLAAVEATLAERTAARDATAAREKEIRALCATAKMSEFATELIASAMAPDAVRAHLTRIAARVDGRLELDPHHPARPTAPVINVAESYAALNRRGPDGRSERP